MIDGSGWVSEEASILSVDPLHGLSEALFVALNKGVLEVLNQIVPM